jgi:hypothetical protein
MAQTAVHAPFIPQMFDLTPQTQPVNGHTTENPGSGRQPAHGPSLLEILRKVYDSDVLHPVMPYNPDAHFDKRIADLLQDGRPQEIIRISNLWHIDLSRGQTELDEKVEELLWLATLLLASTSKPGRKPRLDFFMMHLVTSSLFMPSLLNVVPKTEYKATLLRVMLPVIIFFVILEGRPRINPTLLMSYTETPRPPTKQGLAACKRDTAAVGDLADNAYVNPWPEIVAGALHAPDAHTTKTIRSLYYAAQKYGTTPPGQAIGAFQKDGSESHEGISKIDGTIFVRAAGVVMDTLGWVSHGQKEGGWDRSGLGWDDAWNKDNE